MTYLKAGSQHDIILTLQSPENPAGSYIEDLDMFDEELVMMATKDLNSLLKKRNVAKPRQKDIKQRRRTLKNRYIQDEADSVTSIEMWRMEVIG